MCSSLIQLLLLSDTTEYALNMLRRSLTEIEVMRVITILENGQSRDSTLSNHIFKISIRLFLPELWPFELAPIFRAPRGDPLINVRSVFPVNGFAGFCKFLRYSPAILNLQSIDINHHCTADVAFPPTHSGPKSLKSGKPIKTYFNLVRNRCSGFLGSLIRNLKFKFFKTKWRIQYGGRAY